MDDRPNIVVIMADDLGFGDLGMCNFGASTTPGIDSLAHDGAFMTQHYSASPICAPARAAFMTGRYPQRSGVIDTFPHRATDRISLNERTLGDLLTEAGYVTGLVGKWHSGALGHDYHPNRRGFAEFTGFRGGVQDYYDWRLERNGEALSSDGRYLTDVFTTEAVDFVRRHGNERFFLFLAYTAPHGPFQAPSAATSGHDGEMTVLETITRMVEQMDVGIVALLDELDRQRLRENTLVMFTSDNGPWMRPGPMTETTVRYNIGLAGGKELVHEGGIRVPTVVRWPGAIPSGRTIHDFTHFTDWVPTLLATADHRFAERLPGDGVDLLPLLTGSELQLPNSRFWQWSRYEPTPLSNAAARVGDWKLRYPAVPEILHILPSDPVQERLLRADPMNYRPPAELEIPARDWAAPAAQLFNLALDPGEQFDLAAREGERIGRMQRELDAWYDSVERDRLSLTS